MPEYEYIDGQGHGVTISMPMEWLDKVELTCTECGVRMWRKPHPFTVNWGGIKPSQGEIHPNFQKLIDERPLRLEAEAREKEKS